MTEPRLVKFKSPLASQLGRPGGRSLADAERLAEAALQTHRVSIMGDLGRIVGRLEQHCETAAPEDQNTVYGLAVELVDLAGFFDTGAFFEAAYSLCDLSDKSRSSGRWSWEAVRVHVSALRLLHGRGAGGDPTDGERILAGLRQVVTVASR